MLSCCRHSRDLRASFSKRHMRSNIGSKRGITFAGRDVVLLCFKAKNWSILRLRCSASASDGSPFPSVETSAMMDSSYRGKRSPTWHIASKYFTRVSNPSRTVLHWQTRLTSNAYRSFFDARSSLLPATSKHSSRKHPTFADSGVPRLSIQPCMTFKDTQILAKS